MHTSAQSMLTRSPTSLPYPSGLETTQAQNMIDQITRQYDGRPPMGMGMGGFGGPPPGAFGMGRGGPLPPQGAVIGMPGAGGMARPGPPPGAYGGMPPPMNGERSGLAAKFTCPLFADQDPTGYGAPPSGFMPPPNGFPPTQGPPGAGFPGGPPPSFVPAGGPPPPQQSTGSFTEAPPSAGGRGPAVNPERLRMMGRV